MQRDEGAWEQARLRSPGHLVHTAHAHHCRVIHLRDGEVVLYRVSRSSRWQARIRLLTPKWIRFSTRQPNQIDAARVARERYDEARYRERLGHLYKGATHSFDENLPSGAILRFTHRYDPSVTKESRVHLRRFLDANMR